MITGCCLKEQVLQHEWHQTDGFAEGRCSVTRQVGFQVFAIQNGLILTMHACNCGVREPNRLTYRLLCDLEYAHAMCILMADRTVYVILRQFALAKSTRHRESASGMSLRIMDNDDTDSTSRFR